MVMCFVFTLTQSVFSCQRLILILNDLVWEYQNAMNIWFQFHFSSSLVDAEKWNFFMWSLSSFWPPSMFYILVIIVHYKLHSYVFDLCVQLPCLRALLTCSSHYAWIEYTTLQMTLNIVDVHHLQPSLVYSLLICDI